MLDVYSSTNSKAMVVDRLQEKCNQFKNKCQFDLVKDKEEVRE